MRNLLLHSWATLLLALTISFSAHATEGMWIPTLLKAVEGDMQTFGLELTAADLYSVNQSSLKDAIVLFGGGCTASVISKDGLLLTNHHCGYSQIQQHSSVEHDYLKDGFWAASHKDELPNPGLTATFIVRIDDVTGEMNKGITAGMSPEAEQELFEANRKRIEADATEGTAYAARVKAFNYGNSYFVIVTRTFDDVRLVGAPPSSIGKFGGDTDNWVWPRHTGDFSLFRIYAGADNGPAAYNEANRPWQPEEHLKVNMDGVQEGDFTMVYGFPGRTSVYLTSYAVDYVMNRSNPMRIDMRRNSLALIDAAMLASDTVRIQYAAKQSRISNAYKKWQGQNFGLERNRALQKKTDIEARMRKAGPQYVDMLDKFELVYAQLNDAQFARELFIEYYYYGPEVLRFAERFQLLEQWEELAAKGKLDRATADLEASFDGYFGDYNYALDQALFAKLTELYLGYADPSTVPAVLHTWKAKNGSWEATAKAIYAKSMLTTEEDVQALMDMSPKKALKKLMKDPFYQLMKAVRSSYFEHTATDYNTLKAEEEKLMQTWVLGLVDHFPDRTFWADANSTLRVTFGKAEGSAPKDGMEYHYRTTADGILQKYIPGHADFDLPTAMVDQLRARDYGQWAGADGELQVCFTGSNHTTGGNSGSPTLNGRGELIGLNFDRSWESTMSDILFDPEICRNIMVDIRYVMWVVDRYAGATHLIEELTLVRNPKERPEMDAVPELNTELEQD